MRAVVVDTVVSPSNSARTLTAVDTRATVASTIQVDQLLQNHAASLMR